MKRPRDNQRVRAYRAEDIAFGVYGDLKRGEPFIDIGEVERFVETMIASEGWAGWLPGLTKIRVHKGRGRVSRGGYIHDTPAIRMCPLHLSEPMVLHEVAHVILEYQTKALALEKRAWHGPEWAGTYLLLVLWQMGSEAASVLADEFDAHNVTYQVPFADVDPSAADIGSWRV